MPEEGSESSGGFSLNWNTLLAFLAILGSLLLVSKRLSSHREQISGTGLNQPIGEQTLEARLWEDPFSVSLGANENGHEVEGQGFATLLHQLDERVHEPGRIMILPVMLSSGSFGEDSESRIRSRLAVVSALGLAGYAPMDAEHLGAIQIPWPAESEMVAWKRNPKSRLILSPETNCPLADRNFCSTNSHAALYEDKQCPPSDSLVTSHHMHLRYEWYRLRSFRAGTSWPDPAIRNVVVLWLDDGCFEDSPLLRLPLLLKPLTDVIRHAGASSNAPLVALIGPRRSSTLRQMLPGPFSPAEDIPKLNSNLWHHARQVLTNISIYSATASAMDEVLIQNAVANPPRQSIKLAFRDMGFKSFQNFAVTDDQLAREIFAELDLREVKAVSIRDHIALISEWDTFYARSLQLTYAAVLAVQQTNLGMRAIADFVTAYTTKDTKVFNVPSNLHSFVYLRGLDGQSAGRTTDEKHSEKTAESESRRPLRSIEELKHWAPDANRAEGPAQFDYLARLGDRLEDLEEELHHKNAGHLKAIGIVGSDVYDTLLILQALRPRFPNALFFTTDLDARFWHPSERAWTRNLILASGYALQLKDSLQERVAPFRESVQTSQFAATLAAFGHPAFADITTISPRRFEIGRSHPIDLSVPESAGLHPPSAYQNQTLSLSTVLEVGVALLILLLAAARYWRPLRRLSFGASEFASETLFYTEEDVGGIIGARTLIARLLGSKDKWAQNFSKEFIEQSPGFTEELLRFSGRGTSRDELQMLLLLQFLNRDLLSIGKADRAKHRASRFSALLSNPVGSRLGVIKAARHRAALDARLAEVSERPGGRAQTETDVDSDALRAGVAARSANVGICKLRIFRFYAFWSVALLIILPAAFFLAVTIHLDSFGNPFGEPFSLRQGVSGWPTQILRLVAIALSIGFVGQSYLSLRTMVLEVTRKFRLHFAAAGLPADPSKPLPSVCAASLWKEYCERGRFRSRLVCILKLLALYLIFGIAVFLLGEPALHPLRGPASFAWNKALLILSSLGFVFLALWTIETSFRWRDFIHKLSEKPTIYPKATLDHFSRECGGVQPELLDEWIDLQLIAQITERAGRLVFCPFIVFCVLLLSRYSIWDNWPWPTWLIAIFGSNLFLCATSVLILQNAARAAKTLEEQRLAAKVKKLRWAAAPSKSENQASQAEKLLLEINGLRRGAFVRLRDNPVIGALLLAPGSTALIEILLWVSDR